jgi:hypothetical protein
MTLDITGVFMPSAQNKLQALSGRLYFNNHTGWITWNSYALAQEEVTRLCWLPIELRGDISNSREGMFVIASKSTHQLTVIDFTPMLKRLYKAGFVL